MRSDQYTFEQSVRSLGEEYPPPGYSSDLTAAASQSRVRARVLLEPEARQVASYVAAYLAEEQRNGAFGRGKRAIVGDDLSGGCCIAAYITAVELERRGYAPSIVGGRRKVCVSVCHWWVEADGLYIDPTHGQFRWTIEPLVALEFPSFHRLKALSPREFGALAGHPTLPTSYPAAVERILARLCAGGKT